ncbi:MAG: DedA family protein [Candidatus Marinimicrobia bacterium]|nr:DedA family protein [Candidatus Neomarinimicrobiota bacterium]
MEFIKTIVDFLGQVTPFYLILIIFLASFIENIFPPLPGDTMLVFTAYLFASYSHSLIFLFIFSLLGSVIGFMFSFSVGHHWGKDFFYEKNYKLMPVALLRRIENKFNKYGIWIILINRIFLGMRTVIGVFSGISNIKWWIVLILITFSTAVYNSLLMLMGYYIGDNWEMVNTILHKYQTVSLIIFGILLVIWFFRREKYVENYIKERK